MQRATRVRVFSAWTKRVRGAAVVQRVRPGAVAAPDAGERDPAHPLARLGPVDDRARLEPARSEVDRADDVPHAALDAPRELEQVEPAGRSTTPRRRRTTRAARWCEAGAASSCRGRRTCCGSRRRRSTTRAGPVRPSANVPSTRLPSKVIAGTPSGARSTRLASTLPSRSRTSATRVVAVPCAWADHVRGSGDRDPRGAAEHLGRRPGGGGRARDHEPGERREREAHLHENLLVAHEADTPRETARFPRPARATAAPATVAPRGRPHALRHPRARALRRVRRLGDLARDPARRRRALPGATRGRARRGGRRRPPPARLVLLARRPPARARGVASCRPLLVPPRGGGAAEPPGLAVRHPLLAARRRVRRRMGVRPPRAGLVRARGRDGLLVAARSRRVACGGASRRASSSV